MLADLKDIQLKWSDLEVFFTDFGVPKMLDSCFSIMNGESLVTGFEGSCD